MQFATRTTHDTPTRCRALNARSPRGALTLVELVIAITIILILISAVIVTGRMARDSRKKTQAQQSLSSLANAINQYAAYWPAWKVGTTKVAERGWPHFVASELFGPPYDLVPCFNDFPGLIPPLSCVPTSPTGPMPVPVDCQALPPCQTDPTGNACWQLCIALHNLNECLAYSLTSTVGNGPFLNKESSAGLVNSIGPNGGGLLYPQNGAGGQVRQRLVDSWGTAYRYFWVYRDASAYRGYLPVDVLNPIPAVGFVLESAGPDMRFGNVWQSSATITAQDVMEAEDNLIVSP